MKIIEMVRTGIRRFSIVLAACVVTSCGFISNTGVFSPASKDGAPAKKLAECNIQNPVPRQEAKSPRGNPETYTVWGKTYRVMDSVSGFRERGIASWYGTAFHGNPTSSGERYDMYAMTAAHKHLPLPTYVEVKNLENGRRVIVRVNDRGPFISGRIIDLSYAAATKIGMLGKGTAQVEITVIDPASFDISRWGGDDRCEPSVAATTTTSYPSSGGSVAVTRSQTAASNIVVSETVPKQTGSSTLDANNSSSVDTGVDTGVQYPAQGSGHNKESGLTGQTSATQAVYLQLATYSVSAVANKELVSLERELNRRGISYSAGLYPYFPGGAENAWYRLRLGPIESRSRALELVSDPVLQRFNGAFPVEQ